MHDLIVSFNDLEDDSESDFSVFTNSMYRLDVGYNKLKKFTSPENVAILYFVGNPYTDSLPDITSMWGQRI